ncbi:MAG: class I SAM-dependent methyltransferase [Candidatus Asgardarchaeia archaeon]
MKLNKKVIVRKLYNETSQFYETRYNKAQLEKYETISPFLLDYLISFLNAYKIKRTYKKVLKIVDVGCGTGLFFNYFDKAILSSLTKKIFPYSSAVDTVIKIKYIGIDFAKNMLNIALSKKGKLSRYFILANAEELPLNDDFFDITVSFTVLQNLDNPSEMIHELVRITDTQGLIILSALKKNLNERFFRENVVNAYNRIISSFKIFEIGTEDIGIVFRLSKS